MMIPPFDIEDYKVLWETDPGRLGENVKELMLEGYIPFGECQLAHSGHRVHLTQTMIKRRVEAEFDAPRPSRLNNMALDQGNFEV